MRSNVQESDEGKSLRQKARERMNAKMGKIDIDYAVLYTAFFKNQTKPPLTGHGELYYESKEFETDVRLCGNTFTRVERGFGYAERQDRSGTLAFKHATIRSTSVLSKIENSWFELKFPPVLPLDIIQVDGVNLP